jgi:release factor H-coupled RctB family protein
MGNSSPVGGRAPIHIFYSTRSWIEGNATQQLEAVASLPGVKAVAGMPDLHPGKYGPVGCSILAEQIHPQLVGSDIGCGMGLFHLDLAVRKLRLDRTAERLRALDAPWEGDAALALAEAGLASTPFDASLGTIGRGNHFCELQALEDIIELDIAARSGLDPALAFLLVHSGSRGLGFSILQQQLATGTVTLDPASEAGRTYLAQHDAGVRWAALNRRLIAARAAAAVRADCKAIADLSHNLVEVGRGGVLHRKGTAPADKGLVPIPGSRGTLSYLVEPLAAARPETLASLAHGAGRKFDRASMRGRIRTGRSDRARLARNPFGGVIVCEDRDLLVEEAPEAYKSIDRVIADLSDFGLARVVATFRPLVTFKTARASPKHREHRSEREDRR